MPKAKAYLEIAKRIAKGSREDARQLKKHKADIFRLAAMLTENDAFELPEIIQNHLQKFANAIATDLPDKLIYKEMGVSNIDVQNVFSQIIKNFNLSI